MFKIRTYNKISEAGLREFPSERYVVSDDAENPDAILVRSADLHGLEFGTRLRAIARAGAGVNNIPIDRCTETGVAVFNTPGANANSVKELVIAGMLLCARDVQGGIQWVRENAGNPELAKAVEKEKKRFAGHEILGKTLGVIGLGAIGVLVANAARALGMRVIGFDPYLTVESAWHLAGDVELVSDVGEVLGQSDYLTIHVPLNDETRAMINGESLGRIRRGARVLNFARGGLVDETAILGALDAGQVEAYVTDFPTSVLAAHANVIGVPHLGASTEEAEENCAVMAAQEIRTYLETGGVRNSVNFPRCDVGSFAGTRIVIANRNVPDIVRQISTIMSDAGINIAHFLNRNRGDLAYNIIDVDGDTPDNVDGLLQDIDGVITVRRLGGDQT